MYYGFAGKVLHLDLTSSSIHTESLDLRRERKFLGGFGVGYKLAYDLIKPGIDPFSSDNYLIFSSGTLVGTTVPGAVKISALTKLPLTGTIAWSNGGMAFASMLKWAGYDHLIITGRSEKPVYIVIVDNRVDICDASHIWGKDTIDTTCTIKKNLPDASILCIGPAGENLSNFALAMIDNLSTLGRGGLGAVMGSKNLKAIAIYGSIGINISNKKKFSKTINNLKKRYLDWPRRKMVQRLGMMAAFERTLQETCSTENMTKQEIRDIYGVKQYEEIKKADIACPSCLLRDKDIVRMKEGRFTGLEVPTSYYSEIAIFGSHYAIKDLSEAAYIFDMLNRYGLDAQAMEDYLNFIINLYQNGIINKEHVGELKLGNDFYTLKALIEKLAFRKGIDDALANGWEATIERFGREAENYACIIKNLNVHWEPRLYVLGTMEFAQIVSPKGPYSAFGGSPTTVPDLDVDFIKRHCNRVGAPRDQIDRIFKSSKDLNIGRLTCCFETWAALLSCLGVCNRAPNERFYSASLCSELYSAATGIEMDVPEMVEAAERVWALTRAIIVRDGFTREDDKVPEEWFHVLKTFDGDEHEMHDYFKTKVLDKGDLCQALDDYYDERGWDIEKGIPTRDRLTKLALNNIADNIDKFQ